MSFLMIFYPFGYFQRAKKGLLHWAPLTGPGSFKLKCRLALLMFMAKLHLHALPRNFNSRFTFTIKIKTKMWKLWLFWQFLEKKLLFSNLCRKIQLSFYCTFYVGYTERLKKGLQSHYWKCLTFKNDLPISFKKMDFLGWKLSSLIFNKLLRS